MQSMQAIEGFNPDAIKKDEYFYSLQSDPGHAILSAWEGNNPDH